jgi:hypothetical protein
MTISYTRLAKTFNDLLMEKNPEELREVNARKLAAMGVPQDLT